MRKGDIYWCNVTDYAGKPNRPCVILEILQNDKVKVLPITSTTSYNNITEMYEDLYTCGSKLWGSLNKTIELVDVGTCTPGNICDCQITSKLKNVLKSEGFNL